MIVPLKVAIAKKTVIADNIKNLRSMRENFSVVEIAPTENPLDYIHKTPEEVTTEINVLLEQFFKLDSVIRTANNLPRDIEGFDKLISISTLAMMNIENRRELKYFKDICSRPNRKRESAYRGDSNTVHVTTFSRSWAEARLKELETECERISNLIDRLDTEITVEI